MKTAGAVLLGLGIMAIAVSIIYFMASVDNILEPEAATPITVSFCIAVTGLLFAIVGSILCFVGRNQAKKQ